VRSSWNALKKRGAGSAASARGRIAEQEEQRDRVDDADRPAPSEGRAPADIGTIRRVAREATEDDADVDAHLMEPDGARAGRPEVEVGDQRQGRRDVERLADAHERARGQ